MDEIHRIFCELEKNAGLTDFSVYCETAVAQIKEMAVPADAIDPLLSFMSEHPNLNYGMPGAFVHFVETFPEASYADDLIKSIKKQPTEHNTWMLLRIMNTWTSLRQNEYVQVMKEALLHPTISTALKQILTEELGDFEE